MEKDNKLPVVNVGPKYRRAEVVLQLFKALF